MTIKNCTYCNSPNANNYLKEWNKPDRVLWYCDKHYMDAVESEKESKRKFYEYYSDESVRKWLPEESLKLWHSIDKEYN